VGVSCYWFGAGVIWVVLSKVDLEKWGVEIYLEIGTLAGFMVLSTKLVLQLLEWLSCEVY
jgi:hypothetical protein